MKSWAEQVDATWLGDGRAVERTSRWVQDRIAAHRRLKRGRAREDIAASSVDRLVDDIRALGGVQRWFWATAATCLLAELLFAARVGGTFSAATIPEQRQAAVAFRALRILRNVAFHPAHATADAGAGEPHMIQLIDHLRGNAQQELAQALGRSWASFAARPVASFAVLMLDAAVRGHPDTRDLVRRR